MTYFITIAGRRWPVEITFKTGKDALGWDQCQARTYHALCRHTALTALAQLPTAAIQARWAALTSSPHRPPPAPPRPPSASPTPAPLTCRSTPAPRRSPPAAATLPARHPPIALSAAETARIDRLARDWKAGLLILARLAFQLRWPAWRRRHQARARWHHHATRLAALAT